MPFNSPYKGYFTAGDLIYGLAPARRKLVIDFGVAIMNSGGPATVDQYRVSSMAVLPKTARKDWKSFLRENEKHLKYGSYSRAIRSYHNDEEKFAAAIDNSALLNAAWRAKSKFGMEWTLKNNRGAIHFVLDEIDMGAVVTKTHKFTSPTGDVLAQDSPRGKAPTGVEKERTITHSELRWIYRNRSNPQVQSGVQFWKTTLGSIQACGPPWNNNLAQTRLPSGLMVTWSHAWHLYKPKTERSTF